MENNYKEIISSWIETEKAITCGNESQKRYIKNHEPRFNYLYNVCLKLNPAKNATILDVGRSGLSIMLGKHYDNMKTLGLDIDKDKGGHREIENSNIQSIIFDLNESNNVSKWPKDKFDIIIYSEVIEHLYRAPEYTFLLFHYLLKPNGYLVCTTPNAAYLAKRICLLVGKHPTERIRFYSENPGHYREYTKNELINMALKCNFKIVSHRFKNYRQPIHKFKYKIVKFFSHIIPSWRSSQILIVQK